MSYVFQNGLLSSKMMSSLDVDNFKVSLEC